MALGPEEHARVRRSNALWSVRITLYAANRGRLYHRMFSLRNTSEQAFAGLLVALQNLYGGMLELLARVGSHNSAARDSELFRAISNPGRAIGIVGKLHELVSQLEDAILVCEQSRTSPADEDVRRLLEDTPHIRLNTLSSDGGHDGNTEDRVSAFDYDRDMQLIDWLSDVPYERHHREIRKGRVNNTCEWLLQQPEFKDWAERQMSGTLWLRGSCE